MVSIQLVDNGWKVEHKETLRLGSTTIFTETLPTLAEALEMVMDEFDDVRPVVDTHQPIEVEDDVPF